MNMSQAVKFRRFRKMHHRYWMGGLLTGVFIGMMPACRWTPPEGIANGTQSLQANDVLADHNDGIEKSGYKIPETLAVRGQFRNQTWIFTRAETYPVRGLQLESGRPNLSSLTAEDLSRTQDPYYCAMRWDYGTRTEAGMKFFANRKLVIVTPKQVARAVVVRVVDWGPPVTSEGGIMLSQAALSALGIAPGTTVGVAFEASDSEPTGPVVLGAQ
jgi:hypothetical protein